MLLRNKLSLITLSFFLIAAIGLSYALNYRNELQSKEFGSNAALQQASLWEKVQEGELNKLRDKRWEIRDDVELLKAIENKDETAQHTILRRLFQSFNDRSYADRLELFSKTGALEFSSQETYFPTVTIQPNEINRMAQSGDLKIAGTAIDSGRHVMMIIAIPIKVNGAIEKIAVLSRDISHALNEFKRLTKSEVFLINRRGRLLFGTDEKIWTGISQHLSFDTNTPVHTLGLENQYFSLTSSLAQGAINPTGYVVSARDISESHLAFQKLEWITYGGAAIFLFLAGLALWLYMRHSLFPLTYSIQALASLSQGNFSQHISIRPGKDEVSGIGIAITKFQKNLMRLEQMTKSRIDRGRRQSNIIRRELTGLAETLDEQSRRDILEDLNEVEAKLAETIDMDDGVRAGNELAAMALTLNRLRDRIQNQHGQLAETISELEEALKSKTAYLALQQELEIGTRVQLAMLPDDLPQTPQLRIAGKMIPAKEVGGDFYDFFYLDEKRLAVVVADVSGKGVPAALFMAITRSLLRATAEIFEQPSDCIAALNDAVCDNNKEELFVTVFYGILDLETGTFCYANAGHNPAYHMTTQGSQAVELPLTGGVALGVMDELPYEQNQIQLAVGDGLFLYTDGISEAMDEENSEYGTKKLEDILKSDDGKNVNKLLDDIYIDIQNFAGNAPQADDITSVMLRFDGKLIK